MAKDLQTILPIAVDSKLTMLVDEMPQVAGVAIGFWFPVGSGHELPVEAGLTHFVEHMLFKGTKNRSALEISRQVDRVGGYLNAFTERDIMCLHCTLPAENVALALDIMLEMVYEPVFCAADFGREKDIIRNEILSTDDDIEECAHDSLFALMYPKHAFGQRITGSLADIERQSLADLADYHQRHLVQGTCLVTIAGPVRSAAMHDLIACKLLTYSTRRFPATLSEPAVESAAADFAAFRAMVKAPGSQIHFFSVVPLQRPAAWQTVDFWAFSLISAAYGESMSSRLFTRLREERGLCYNVSSFISFYKFGAMWGVNAATSPGQLAEFVDVYLAEAQRLYTLGLEKIEIEEAVTRMAGSLALAADDTEFRMKRLARQYLFDGTTTPIGEIRRQFREVNVYSKDYLDAYIRQYLDPANESILIYGRLPASVQKTARDRLAARLQEVALP
ncbi:MAG: hypothetical protein A2087_05560 [Spirochaetes bacterium GWD1_61_31]|nr:MAG: hypothetical protein A2Y37_03630 [Spirochaetes bacterium GWB1_60_80]OHD35103.1 MAG: hypothetical protein A2004_05305 [Spirochaetes bacterium GWC1_61_12]OHD43621.1 MAG: hypothetical protein A2087_05560 [Spirochaetes bacterium GWD1_61_31]OHD44113.1 MAG: hypothetical protein A2Y35_01985 [Spirochaetes bacterium GWE1_60_18]OHD61846.1 MAG: hypothetical protein A2Y32_13890 [Spirochaetes bacterium GWF1_60_12]HAW85089.1 hypothetical protein [Spirochaetaceae bacterium]